jgi:hypothetical protein
LKARKILTLAATAAVAVTAATMVTACSHAQPAISQCAMVTGHGYASGTQNVIAIVHPGQYVNIGNDNTAWYYPCDARNYVTAPAGGDRKDPMSVRTGPGTDGTPGMPVQVWTSVYWTPTQVDAVMPSFLSFCLKYGCAESSDQTDASVALNPHSSTPGWNNMLAENMGPAVDRATADVIGQFGPSLWTDHAAWSRLGTLVAQNLNAELAKETGNSHPFFCGDSSTVHDCTQMAVVVSNVTPTDPAVQQLYNQQIAAEQALGVNAARLAAAQKLYGPYAQYFLGLEDLAQQCRTCTIYVGAPSTIPAGKK